MTDTDDMTTGQLTTELLRRVRGQKRAIEAGLDRERELRETVSGMRVAFQHEQNQRTAAENRAESAEAEREEVARYFRASVENESQLLLDVADLRTENERLRDEMAFHLNHGLGIPRVIRPDEVREGQTVAVRLGSEWSASDVIRRGDGRYTISSDAGMYSPHKVDTIVLLAEAPEGADEEDPERRGEVIDLADVRDGDVVDVWSAHGDLLFPKVTVVDGHVDGMLPGDELRLISRPCDCGCGVTG